MGDEFWGAVTCVLNLGSNPPKISLTGCHGPRAKWICSNIPPEPTPPPVVNDCQWELETNNKQCLGKFDIIPGAVTSVDECLERTIAQCEHGSFNDGSLGKFEYNSDQQQCQCLGNCPSSRNDVGTHRYKYSCSNGPTDEPTVEPTDEPTAEPTPPPVEH